MTQTLKRHLIVYIAVAALTIVTPQFEGRAEAGETSGFFFVIEGRASFVEDEETAFAQNLIGELDTVDIDNNGWSGRLGAG